ncbi:MAG: hypothetical protein HYY06_02340, partial [Deltaproteobacteria bacterium]|nr:hypothetical protein [Deltaproteobacteria bacterium]
MSTNDPRTLTDDVLFDRLTDVAVTSKRVEAEMIALIAEFDGRRLYLQHACSSMFAYCLRELNLSESV